VRRAVIGSDPPVEKVSAPNSLSLVRDPICSTDKGHIPVAPFGSLRRTAAGQRLIRV
jgi:hypothetical protein